MDPLDATGFVESLVTGADQVDPLPSAHPFHMRPFRASSGDVGGPDFVESFE